MTINADIIPDNDQTLARREHLDKIRELVGNAYPNKFRRSNVVADSLEGVAKSLNSEDTITALSDQVAIKRIVNSDAFNDALSALEAKTKAGERPTPEDLAPVNEELNKINVRVSGRLAVPPRVMGKAAFVHLSDGRERLQIYVRRDEVRGIHNADGAEIEEGWELFNLLDHGDFIGVEGFLFVTKTGELSVHVRTLQFLAKALVPMPDKMHGVSDPEIRQRQRYVDLIAASLKVDAPKDEQGDDAAPPQEELNTRQVFERRSKLISAMRRHLDDHGYLEVETPMLSPIASGAAARPFKTHHNALDIDLYARIAPELYLKRLVVGGFERVYELNRNFRNEGVSTRHNPEFTMLEFYTAYKDVNWMMDFCEEMLRTTIKRTMGDTQAQFNNTEIDFAGRFTKLTMKEAILNYWHTRFRRIPSAMTVADDWLDNPQQVSFLAYFLKLFGLKSINEVIEKMWGDFPHTASDAHQYLKDQFEFSWSRAEATRHKHIADATLPEEIRMGQDIAYIFEELAEEMLIQPSFIHDFPKAISPLSKASPDNPAIAERFELYIAGMEVANGFSELNDPVEQHARFEEQAGQRERGDDEAMQMDLDYVRALAYGMPPAAGIGIGIDRLTMLLTNRRSIRDVILFPHMRPQRRDEPETEETRDEADTH